MAATSIMVGAIPTSRDNKTILLILILHGIVTIKCPNLVIFKSFPVNLLVYFLFFASSDSRFKAPSSIKYSIAVWIYSNLGGSIALKKT